MLVFHKCVM
uniref:rRNA methylase leader peptide n=1 Tax=Enterococcus faecium TaxID=1352 RepID=I0AYT6_ENTFC|nr:rRNA methylase leader peptide [Enterococcus faecium]